MTRLTDQVAEKSKILARVIRKSPALGYSGSSNKLTYQIGGKNVMEAEKAERGHWNGATAMEYDEENNRIITHVRHRNPRNRGYKVSICKFDRDNLNLYEIISIEKKEINARSIEGGELIKQDGEFRWFISYQHDTEGDWRIEERRAPTIKELESEGNDLNIYSRFFHNKDPTFVNGDFYFVSYSKNWMCSKIEKTDIDHAKPTPQELDVEGIGNARVTSGGILGNEIFADTWPDIPRTNISNILWTSDERGATGTIKTNAIGIESSEHFVSACGGSTKYIDAENVGNSVYLLWQEQKNCGGNDLVGTKIDISEYKELF